MTEREQRNDRSYGDAGDAAVGRVHPPVAWLAVLCGGFLLALVAVFVFMVSIAVTRDDLRREARALRIEEREVPSRWGNIYSSDGYLLASTVLRYDVYWDITVPKTPFTTMLRVKSIFRPCAIRWPSISRTARPPVGKTISTTPGKRKTATCGWLRTSPRPSATACSPFPFSIISPKKRPPCVAGLL